MFLMDTVAHLILLCAAKMSNGCCLQDTAPSAFMLIYRFKHTRNEIPANVLPKMPSIPRQRNCSHLYHHIAAFRLC